MRSYNKETEIGYDSVPLCSILLKKDIACSRKGEILQLERAVTEERWKNLQHAKRFNISFLYDALPSCMDIDRIENDFMVCGNNAGSLTVINLSSSEQSDQLTCGYIRTVDQHTYAVNAVQFYSQDMTTFISAGADQTVRFFDVNSKVCVEQYAYADSRKFQCTSMHWNETDRRNPLIALGIGGFNHVKLLDLRIGHILTDIRFTSSLYCARWIPTDSHLLACGDDDGGITIWDIRSPRKPLHIIKKKRKGGILSIRFSPDGLWMVALSPNLYITVYSAVTWKCIFSKRVLSNVHNCKNACQNAVVCNEGLSLKVAIPTSDFLCYVTIEPDLVNASYKVQQFRDNLRDVLCCQFRPRLQQLFTGGNDIICWSYDSSYKSKDLDAIARAFQDDWSDEEEVIGGGRDDEDPEWSLE